MGEFWKKGPHQFKIPRQILCSRSRFLGLHLVPVSASMRPACHLQTSTLVWKSHQTASHLHSSAPVSASLNPGSAPLTTSHRLVFLLQHTLNSKSHNFLGLGLHLRWHLKSSKVSDIVHFPVAHGLFFLPLTCCYSRTHLCQQCFCSSWIHLCLEGPQCFLLSCSSSWLFPPVWPPEGFHLELRLHSWGFPLFLCSTCRIYAWSSVWTLLTFLCFVCLPLCIMPPTPQSLEQKTNMHFFCN